MHAMSVCTVCVQLMALLMTAVSGFCTPEAVVPPRQVLWQVTAPTLTVALQPASCPVAADPDTGTRSVDWSNCTAAKLAITLTPSKAFCTISHVEM